MAAPKNFRSALNGFHREDVIRYIEYMNSRHAAQVHELNTENEFLRGKLVAAQKTADKEPEALTQLNEALKRIDELEQKCAQLEAQRDEALANAQDPAMQDRVEALTRERDEALANAQIPALQEQVEILARERDAALAQAQSSSAQELEAYRRAERTERLARERADQVYAQVNGVLADATVQVDDAAAKLDQVSEQILSRLSQLQEAVAGSKQALNAAAKTMYAIRPTEEA